MKNTKYIAILAFLVFASSCKKGNDLYISPNQPLDVTPAVLLTSLEVNSFLNTEGDLARVSSILDEQMAGTSGQYTTLQNYDLKESDYDNHWQGLYGGAMENAHIIITKYGATDPYYTGFAQVIMAINLGIATDLFGDVPYSQAFMGDKGSFQPAYDSQQSVIASIQTLLDNAIVNFGKAQSANLHIPGGDDLIFGGDPAKWTKAAWVLKARYANRLSLKDPKGSATLVLQYLANGITSASDNMENTHTSAGNSQNQWGAFQATRAGNLVGNKVFIDALNANNDPRLPFYFSPAGNGSYYGADITKQDIDPAASTIGPYFDVSQNYPVVSLHEAKFLEAEAKVRLGQDASTALNDGIKASVAYVTKGANSGSTIATYSTATANLAAVMTEKWKALFGEIEPYNDYRRTGLPAVITPRPGSAGAIRSYIPVRLPTPDVERTNNPNAKVVALDVPVWWATK